MIAINNNLSKSLFVRVDVILIRRRNAEHQPTNPMKFATTVFAFMDELILLLCSRLQSHQTPHINALLASKDHVNFDVKVQGGENE